jgi:hypothetical protein
MRIFALEFIGADEEPTMYHAVSHAALIRKMVADVQIYLQRSRQYRWQDVDSFELFMELAEQGDIACVKAHPTYKYYDVAEIEVAE